MCNLKDLERRREVILRKKDAAEAKLESLHRELEDIQEEARSLGIIDIDNLGNLIYQEEESLGKMKKEIENLILSLEKTIKEYEV